MSSEYSSSEFSDSGSDSDAEPSEYSSSELTDSGSDLDAEASSGSSLPVVKYGRKHLKWNPSDFQDSKTLLNFLIRTSNVFAEYFVNEEGDFGEWQKPAYAMQALRMLRKTPKDLKALVPGLIKESGLGGVLVKVMTAHPNIEKHPLLAERAVSHRWGPQIARELLRYTQESQHPVHTLPLNTDTFDAQAALRMVHLHVPFVARPECAFVFLAYENFLWVWDEILAPATRAQGTEIVTDHLLTIFCHMSALCQTDKIPDFIKNENPYLYSVMEHTAILKKTLKQADYELQQLGRPHCHHCQNQPLELQCQRWIQVDSRTTNDVNQKLFYEFDDTDQIPYVRKKNRQMDSIHVNTLPAPGIEHRIGRRTNLNPECGRDIIHLVDRETGDEVGGVVFDGLSKSSLQILQEHHHAFKISAENVKRGNAFQKLDYGKMAAAGFCQPQGGAVGGGYGNSYKLSQVKFEATTNKVLADQYVGRLFKMAMDSGLVLQVVSKAAINVFKYITALANDAGTFPVGQHRLNIFYCWNYIAPLHCDKDRTYTISVSTARGGNPDHYNFCYARWGVILYITVGAIWWFNGNDTHGTVSPTRNALEHIPVTAVSDGFVIVLREKDAKAATELRAAAASIPRLTEIWG